MSIDIDNSIKFINNFNLNEKLTPINEKEVDILADKLRARISTLESSREKLLNCVQLLKSELETKKFDENLEISLASGDSLIIEISNKILQTTQELISKKPILDKIISLCKMNIQENNSKINQIKDEIKTKDWVIIKTKEIGNLESEIEKLKKSNEEFQKKIDSAHDAILNIDDYLKKDQHVEIYSEGSQEQAIAKFNHFIVPTLEDMEKLYPTEKYDLNAIQNMKEQILFVKDHKVDLQNIVETIKKQQNLKKDDFSSHLNPLQTYANEKLEAPLKKLDQLVHDLNNKEKMVYDRYSLNQEQQKLDSHRFKSNFEKILDYEITQLSGISANDWVSFNPYDPSLKNWIKGDLKFTLDPKDGSVTSSNYNVYVFSDGEWLIQLKSPENNIQKLIRPQELKSQVQKDIIILSKLTRNDLIPSQNLPASFFTPDYSFGIIQDNSGKFQYATNLNSSPPLSYQFENGKWNFYPQYQDFLPEVNLKDSDPESYWVKVEDELFNSPAFDPDNFKHQEITYFDYDKNANTIIAATSNTFHQWQKKGARWERI